MAARRLELHVQIARDIFGWQWRNDWQAWCPPGWPARDVLKPTYVDKLRALERHGGAPYGCSGAMDDRGRPVIPSYQYIPDATEILWNWLYTQPGIDSVRFFPLPLPPASWQGVRPWRCEIVAEPDRVATGEANSHTEALCRAALALAHERQAPQSRWPTGRAYL